MRIHRHITHTVVDVGFRTADGSFCPQGTGVLGARLVPSAAMGIAYQVNVLVTASQLLDEIPGPSILVRINAKDGGTIMYSIDK